MSPKCLGVAIATRMGRPVFARRLKAAIPVNFPMHETAFSALAIDMLFDLISTASHESLIEEEMRRSEKS